MPNSSTPLWRLIGRTIVQWGVGGVVLVAVLWGATVLAGNSQVQSVKYQKAIACELAIPSDPDTGRDLALVAKCFTDQGLEAPAFTIREP